MGDLKSTESPRHEADIAIMGGGPVAMALALALGSARPPGLSVLLVGAPQRLDRGGPARAYALARGTCAMLEALGLWTALEAHAQPMERVVVTDGRPSDTNLSLLEFGVEEGTGPSAHLIEETDLLPVLDEAVGRIGAVDRVGPALPIALSAGADRIDLELSDGRQVRARLLVAADGGRSRLRDLARIKTVGWDYGQAGLVAAVEHEKPHHGVAVERFFPAGPFAILPLMGNRSSLVWTEARADAQHLAAAPEAEFRAALEARFGRERGAVGSIGPRATFSLSFHIARSFITERLALVGDAAHAVHPLAGQGLNLGLRDAAALAESIVEAHRLGLDIGSATVLERYQRWRRFDTITAALGFDGLNRLFSNDNDGLRAIRDLGLGVVERLPFVKRLLLREAAGQMGDVPRLLAGEAL